MKASTKLFLSFPYTTYFIPLSHPDFDEKQKARNYIIGFVKRRLEGKFDLQGLINHVGDIRQHENCYVSPSSCAECMGSVLRFVSLLPGLWL